MTAHRTSQPPSDKDHEANSPCSPFNKKRSTSNDPAVSHMRFLSRPFDGTTGHPSVFGHGATVVRYADGRSEIYERIGGKNGTTEDGSKCHPPLAYIRIKLELMFWLAGVREAKPVKQTISLLRDILGPVDVVVPYKNISTKIEFLPDDLVTDPRFSFNSTRPEVRLMTEAEYLARDPNAPPLKMRSRISTLKVTYRYIGSGEEHM